MTHREDEERELPPSLTGHVPRDRGSVWYLAGVFGVVISCVLVVVGVLLLAVIGGWVG
jgi:hypothetical protein